MPKPQLHIFLLFIILFGWKSSIAQGPKSFGKNAVSFNLTSCFVNEINVSYERYISHRKCIEIDGGIVFVNDFLLELSKDWSSSQVFSEHGYAARVHYKIFSSNEDQTKKWRDYKSPGIVFKHLYYNEQWFTNELTNSKGEEYYERIYQSRIRNKLGLEFLWGKVYELNRTMSFDFFYGGGIIANFVETTNLKTIPDSRRNEIVEENKIYNSIYFRPMARVGFKLKVRF